MTQGGKRKGAGRKPAPAGTITQTGNKTMTTTNALNAELTKSKSPGGFNGCSGGNNKYVPSRLCWTVFYTDTTGYRAELNFKRKMDAVAVFEWMIATDWDGAGDYEGMFMKWAHETKNPVWHSFKGEL